MKTMRIFLFVVLVCGAGVCTYFSGCSNQPQALNIRMEAAASIINPLLRSTGYSSFVAAQVFQTLCTADPATLVMQPALAKNVPTARKVTDGPHQGELAYDIEIQDDAKWDNGTPVTGEDFLFTLKLVMNPGLDTKAYRGYYEYLTGAEVDPANPKKMTVYMRQFYILAQEALCSTPVYPVYNYDPKGLMKNISLADLLDTTKAKAYVESADGKAFAEEFMSAKYTNDPNFISGSGPYRLKSMNGEQGVVLTKKAGWWGDNAALKTPMLAAYPEQLVYKIVKSEPAIVNMLQTEDLDIVTDVSPALFLEMQKDTHLTRLYEFKTGWVPRYGRLLLNLRQSDTNLLTDLRVRRALAYAIDYEYIIKDIQQGFAQPIVGPIHPAKPYYAKDLPLYTYQPKEAQRLLAEAGWKDSDQDGILDKMINGRRTKLSLRLLSPAGVPVPEQTANNIRDRARQIQIEIVIDPQDIANITKKTTGGEFQIAALGATTQVGLDELNQYYHSDSPDNRGRYHNARLDSIIDQVRVTENETERNALYVEAQRIIHDEVPAIFLFASLRRYIVAKKYNYVLTPGGIGFYEQMFQLKTASGK